jgi:ATP-grasp domain, R2K clade family 3
MHKWYRSKEIITMAYPDFKLGSVTRQFGLTIDETTDLFATAQAFAERVLMHCPPISAFVLDVGTRQSGQWAVVEPNAAWGSGLYECDPERVLDVVQHATLSQQ